MEPCHLNPEVVLSFSQMSERAEILFRKLQSRKAIHALIEQSEDSDFDCKEWHGPDAMKVSIAKAACGFANATGGVIVIGMSTRGTGANMPDVVTGENPVSDIGTVSSAVLDIILKQVEPGIEGVQIHAVRDLPRTKSGFVLVYVPESEGSPQRSAIDSKFYVRIASGTLPMAYFQIEDRFGRRPHARLIVEVKHDAIRNAVLQFNVMERHIAVMLTNEGRGLARFPAVRFQRQMGVGLPNQSLGPFPIWSLSQADNEWISFRGGTNDVVYPGESLRIATIIQSGQRVDNVSTFKFPEITITTEAVCDGMPAHRQTFRLDAAEWP